MGKRGTEKERERPKETCLTHLCVSEALGTGAQPRLVLYDWVIIKLPRDQIK